MLLADGCDVKNITPPRFFPTNHRGLVCNSPLKEYCYMGKECPYNFSLWGVILNVEDCIVCTDNNNCLISRKVLVLLHLILFNPSPGSWLPRHNLTPPRFFPTNHFIANNIFCSLHLNSSFYFDSSSNCTSTNLNLHRQ